MRSSIYLFVLILSCLAATASARVRYVSNTQGNDNIGTGLNTSPYKTIQKAATVAMAGDTVAILAGIYRESDIQPRNSGKEGRDIVFRPASRTDTVTICGTHTDNSNLGSIFDLSSKSYIRIESLHFADTPYLRSAIRISSSAHHITVAGCTFSNLGNPAYSGWDANSMIWIYKSTDVTIANNRFDSICGDGISINSSAMRNLICHNSFTNFMGKNRAEAGSLWSRAIDVQDHDDGLNVIAFNYFDKDLKCIWLDRNGSRNYVLRNEGYESGTLVFNESRCTDNTRSSNWLLLNNLHIIRQKYVDKK